MSKVISAHKIIRDNIIEHMNANTENIGTKYVWNKYSHLSQHGPHLPFLGLRNPDTKFDFHFNLASRTSCKRNAYYKNSSHWLILKLKK